VSDALRSHFDRLMAEHGAGLRRVASLYARPGADHEDLVQDVALAIWLALPHFRGESSERTFVFRVAHNRGTSHAWKRRARATVHGDGATDRDVGEVADTVAGPDAQTATRQRARRLLDALRALPLGHRQVLSLALEELPHAEIGAVLGIREDHVAVRLHRARHALRALLRAAGEE
jgi:RNA polymerase sigma factor (sigma-70 family)